VPPRSIKDQQRTFPRRGDPGPVADAVFPLLKALSMLTEAVRSEDADVVVHTKASGHRVVSFGLSG
jgi:hypothetical protein